MADFKPLNVWPGSRQFILAYLENNIAFCSDMANLAADDGFFKNADEVTASLREFLAETGKNGDMEAQKILLNIDKVYKVEIREIVFPLYFNSRKNFFLSLPDPMGVLNIRACAYCIHLDNGDILYTGQKDMEKILAKPAA
ncbi:MAG: hypothetical protein Q3966_05280 [Neisseria sp.]|nr:hypothetical protein [Neisseria sp.]